MNPVRDKTSEMSADSKMSRVSNGVKLVVATPLYPPEIGGPATYAALLEKGLPQAGIEVELVKFSEVRHLPKIIRHYAYYRRVRDAARTADAVLALDPVSVGLPAMKAAQKEKKPFFVKIVGDYAWEQGQQRFGITETLDAFVETKRVPFPVRMLRRIQTRVARGATRVIVPSGYLKGIVMAWGIPAGAIEVIYNAVHLESPGTVPAAVAALPRPLVVTAARLVPWKGIEGVIDAVSAIPGASLAIVGEGPERGILERKAAGKLPGRSVCIGAVSHQELLAILQSADAFVLNSSYEGLSHVVIEALALGAPVIATAIGGNPELIVTGENGLLVSPGDAAALEQALTRLLGDEALRSHLSSQARESVGRFSVETMLASLKKVITAI